MSQGFRGPQQRFELRASTRPWLSRFATPNTPLEPFKDALEVCVRLELSKTWTACLSLQQFYAGSCVFFCIMAAFTTVLDLATAPFLCEPSESRFQWPTSRVVVKQGRVNATRVTVLYRTQVGFERMS